jgi:hypothetical protein
MKRRREERRKGGMKEGERGREKKEIMCVYIHVYTKKGMGSNPFIFSKLMLFSPTLVQCQDF